MATIKQIIALGQLLGWYRGTIESNPDRSIGLDSNTNAELENWFRDLRQEAIEAKLVTVATLPIELLFQEINHFSERVADRTPAEVGAGTFYSTVLNEIAELRRRLASLAGMVPTS